MLGQLGDVVAAVHEHAASGSIEQMLVSATEMPESATDFFGAWHGRTLPATSDRNRSVESGADGASRDPDPRRRHGPELAEATRRVLEATGVEIDWTCSTPARMR
jgi:hypothetical protein